MYSLKSVVVMMAIGLLIAHHGHALGGPEAQQVETNLDGNVGLIDGAALDTEVATDEGFLTDTTSRPVVVTPGTALANVGHFLGDEKEIQTLAANPRAVELEQFIITSVSDGVPDPDTESQAIDLSGLVPPIHQGVSEDHATVGAAHEQAVLVGEVEFQLYDFGETGQ